uniref:DUF4218 domain-containing protein n=1 Tax=Cajanus cajan TaxID=3821 RepID=A0A151RBT9_CAJCA|nr:hypothetical protein KK1_038597 [Cajanus cajan]
MLLKDNTLSDCHSEAKKVLCPMGLQYKKIHACPNDCILYRKEFETVHKCPRCGVSQYKVKDGGGNNDEDIADKGPPAKMLWYLPIISRFKQLFANAMNLTWHGNKRNCDGLLHHPADSPQKEKMSFCRCLGGVKVPQGYSSNVKSLVSLSDLKLVGLKSHDCHVLMQQLLPVAIRDIFPNNVRSVLTRFCFFFNAICAKVIDPDKLDELENEAIIILCELEMYFPPAFFDIMIHLIVHLVREIKLCGLVYLRWMYPVERYMKIQYILNNTDEVLPYISEHQTVLKKNNPRMNEKSLVNEHNKTFLKWFKEKVFSDDSASETLKCLANEPKYNVYTYTGYDINKFSFYTKSQDDNSTMQNSGVTLQAQSMHFSSRNDKNPVVASTSYYGVIEEIWEINYTKFKVPIFKCKWVDINTGVRTNLTF